MLLILLETVDDTNQREELQDLQQRLNSKIRVCPPFTCNSLEPL